MCACIHIKTIEVIEQNISRHAGFLFRFYFSIMIIDLIFS